MQALLVNPKFPDSYWSGRYSLPFVRRRSIQPPLPLITVAALLPPDWSCRLLDANIETVRDEDLRAADVVLLTGMLMQQASLHDLIGRCRRLGVRTVVGGPYATEVPGDFDAADHVFIGEGESLVPTMASELSTGRARRIYEEKSKPDLTSAPPPRYDLLDVDAYHQMAIQFSRGCPFTCEFCDIISVYGRVPRTKTSGQIVAELEAIRATGFKGDVFFVDDNFIGNKKAVRKVLPELAGWRNRFGRQLEFYTEASVNLADDIRLVDAMIDAGFTKVFLGIETPSPEALREARKLQNLDRDVEELVRRIQGRGLDVWGGFILGFDSDGPDCFDIVIDCVEKAAIPYAMVGMLTAFPTTPLYKRLESDGRLRPGYAAHGFQLTNVITRMPTETMIEGYRRVLETLYDPKRYLERCRRCLERWRKVPGVMRDLALRDFGTLFRLLVGQGVRADYRRDFWAFLLWTLRNQPRKLGRAMAMAAAGHHFIEYTRRTVVPGLLEAGAREALLRDVKRPKDVADELPSMA